MDKQDELEKAVLDICVCGEIMIGVGKRLAGIFGVKLPDGEAQENTPAEAVQEAPSSVEPAPTLEDVRAVLTQKSVDGLTWEVKALIARFGAKRLSDIPSEKYAELLKEAEALGHGS